jgi:hypothetical protein
MQGFTLDGNVLRSFTVQTCPNTILKHPAIQRHLEKPDDTLAEANWERPGGLVAGAMRTSHELGGFVSNRRKIS